jgi:alcohol dehydrogenase class IV
LLKDLAKQNIKWVLYGKVQPNPTTDNVEGALSAYKEADCQGIVAVGGGSSMDCAKICGARLVKPQSSILQMKGMFKIKKKLPPVFAVPTTAGTGSENTMTAVITDPLTHSKYPQLTAGLPAAITATTGLDALSHAIEPYIGLNCTREIREHGRQATRLIFENLYTAYTEGNNLDARAKMLEASYHGGICLRVGVGYVHALAHALGGKYNLPHGYLIAVILPHMLRFYGKAAERRLAELADVSGLTRGEAMTPGEKADLFIDSIFELNKKMGIPYRFNEINPQDFDEIILAAYAEASPLYPVPRLMDQKELKQFLNSLLASGDSSGSLHSS